MDTNGILRGIEIPEPSYTKGVLPNALNNIPYYSNLHTFFPSLKGLFSIEDISNEEIWFDNNYKVTHINIVNEDDIKGNCKIQVRYKDTSKKLNAYLKITHLIDPVIYVKKNVDLCNINTDEDIKKKLNNPMNQAYVETIASYAFGKLREEDISPHFNLFYGAFSSEAKKYSYNISEEVESYRMYKWFWSGIEKNIMTIQVVVNDDGDGDGDGDVDSDGNSDINVNGNSKSKENSKHIYDEIMRKPDYCLDNHEDIDDVEELNCDNCDNSGEILSLDSASISTHKSSDNDSNSKREEEEDDDDNTNVYLNLQNFPVMMILTENNDSTLDDLLEDYEEVGAEPGEKLWEEKWSAWLFQVIASLSAAQTLFGFTHNDLHSNNIVWSYTDELYLFYKTNNNKLFRVPTYGKLFKLIDFGRSIFSINDKTFISDDFEEGNDAATQYNFPPLSTDTTSDIVYPNPSFDLARLTISIFESLFPNYPEEKKDAQILSQEQGRIVKETTSDLYNILWTWLIDSDGRNILWNDLNEERFPDFELYVHIGAKSRNSIPKEQIYKKPFKKFLIESKPKNTKIYSLFV